MGAQLTTPEPVLQETDKPGRRPQPRSPLRVLVLFFALLAMLIGVGILVGVLPRRAREQALFAAAQNEGDRPPVVNVIDARAAPARFALDLSCDLQAQVESPIFARVDGYLSKRLVDYGDRVKAGQALAEIETPELDQQISQARATLAQSESALKQIEANLALAQANLKLANLTYTRWKELTDRGVFSRQDSDQKEADLGVRKAELDAAQAAIHTGADTVRANEANVRRLQEMKSFARVTAPFEGVITARNVDIGTLINSGNNGPAREMFRLAQIRTLRIFVNVPQSNVGAIRDGQTAELRVQERPGQVFQARVDRTTSTVDPNSRSMLAVLQAANPRGVLLPGMYAQVRFVVERGAPGVLIPGDSLIVGRQGTRVAVVGPERRIHFRTVQIGQDLGAEVEVTGGLSAGERVVVNPTDAVREGALVEVRDAAKK
jgi:RND family efflux transporter MFP subunit